VTKRICSIAGMASAERKAPTASVAAHLALLALCIIAPLLLLALVLLNNLVETRHRNVNAELESNAMLLASLTDNEIDTTAALSSALGRMTFLKVGDHEGFKLQAKLALQSLKGVWLNVADASGTVVMTTLADVADQRAAPNADRQTQLRAIASGKPVVSDVLEGMPAHPHVAFVTAPVADGDGRARYTLSIALLPETFFELISGKFPAGTLVGILDRSGRFVARVPDQEHRIGKLASEGWRTAIRQRPAGLANVRSLEGDMTVVAYRPTAYGWTVGLSYRQSTIEAPIRAATRTIWLTAAIGGLLTLMLTWWLARRIVEPAGLLMDAASNLANGRPVQPIRSGVKEFDSVTLHFAAMAQQLENRNLQVRQSEARLRLALDAAESGTWSWDARSGQRKLDQRALDIVGVEPQTPISDAMVLSRIHPDDRALVKAAVRRAIGPNGNGLFKAEFRVQTPRHGQRWILSQARADYDEQGLQALVGVVRDITERRRASEQIRELMREVNHRSKNMLAVVQAIARLTAKTGDPKSFLAGFSERLNSLAASQDLLVQNDWQGVELAELVTAQLAHFKDMIGSRVLIDGPSVRLQPAAAQGIGMAIYELATNAGKYGALSNSEGSIRIFWELVGLDAPTFSISWLEQCGARIEAPSHNGFGQTVTGKMVEAAVHGTAETEFSQTGLSWKLTAPATSTLEAGSRA